MSPETRSRVMARIKRDCRPKRISFTAQVRRGGLAFAKHVSDLAGTSRHRLPSSKAGCVH